ncbi:pyridoxal-phosphate dependent enzyme [Altibacter sp.]|uniref:1-aminocyclopropane-1-carboxylate deaminase/D-cysteine desulfhydrase n=1 Tax=Altibacter sp. TaxID=2024823 RepID=UPI000C92BD1E|nr:pyridoxal-phosphate dependent enzyme [Altibacter sp.]MAP54530.1 1-aminocyclopropane-1-carboxylate deaminase [Altibacter sp.]
MTFNSVLFSETPSITTQEIRLPILTEKKCALSILREDQIHPIISGNKYRKLKYSIANAHNMGCTTLLTFGGAYSNHIAAVAGIGSLFGFKTVGIIRGEELSKEYHNNPTLSYAEAEGMKLHFISREEYRRKADEVYLKMLRKKYPGAYIIPEGGTSSLAVQGCTEILTPIHEKYDVICTSVGTGGTLAGLVEASYAHQTVLGFSALQGTFQKKIVEQFTEKTNFSITDAYSFGGYAKIDAQLIRCINSFREDTGILLDPVYTGKMIYGILDLIEKGYFKKNSRILAVHTGGLQGITGMNQLLKQKNLPQIIV